MLAVLGLMVVLALGLAPLASTTGAVPAGGATASAAGVALDGEAPEPVTLISLTDLAGEPTEIAVDGLEALAPGAAAAAPPGSGTEQEPGTEPAPRTEQAPGTEPAPATEPAPGTAPAAPAALAATVAMSADAPPPSAQELADIAVLTPPIPAATFLVAGVTWDGGAELAPGSHIFVRVLERGRWTPWIEVQPDGAAGTELAGRAGTDPFVTGGADAVQIQITGDAAALPPGLDLSLIPANPAPPTEAITQAPAEPVPAPTEDPVAPPDAAHELPPAADGEAAAGDPSAHDAHDHADTHDHADAHADAGDPNGSTLVDADAAGGRAADLVYADLHLPDRGDAYEIALAALRGDKPVTARPQVTTREGWGADESMMTWTPSFHDLQAAVVHHTAGTNTYTREQSPGVVRGIYYFHAVTRDWGDIGYNFLVDRYGRVYEGRSGTLQASDGQMPQGAHAKGYNSGSLGISAMGDFTQADAPAVILERMADVIAWRFSLAEIDPGTDSGFVSPGSSYRPEGEPLGRIFGHGDVAYTTCPSPHLYGRLDSLKAAVERRIDEARVVWHSPSGSFDAARGVPGGVDVRGWAIDPDTADPVYVWVTVDGVGRHVQAAQTRPDVEAAHPGYGSAHGFGGVVGAAPGSRQVCVTASNVSDGRHVPLGCRSVTVPGGPPTGAFDAAVAVPGGVQVRGWALDPDTTAPVYVWMTVDGAGRHVLANRSRPDVGRAFPDYGAGHGYETVLSAGPGRHEVCAVATNVGAGSHRALGCRTVTVLAGSPIGNVEAVRAVDGGIEIRGWAIDPDTTSPVYVWATVDATGRHVYANGTRADVAGAYPGYGASHGFRATLTAGPGAHQVCVTVANVGAGSHRTLSCTQVTTG